MLRNAPSETPGQLDVFLPYDLNYIPEEILQRAKSELFEDEETKVHSLKLLRSKLKDETDLNWQDDDLFLMAFLRARKYDVKRAFTLIKNFYSIVKKHDELYLDINYDDVRRAVSENTIGFLPHRDKDGCPILVLRSAPWNPLICTPGDFVRALSCTMLYATMCSPASQITGVKVIADLSGVGLSRLPYLSLRYVWLLSEGLKSSFPARLKAVHVVNEGHVIYYIWSIFKPLLGKKIAGRIHFHGKHINNLHKSFSPSILPADFGGDLPPFDNSEWASKMEESSAYFSHVYSHAYKKREDKSAET